MPIRKTSSGYTASYGGTNKTFKKKADAERFAKKYKAAKTNTRAGTKSTTSKRKRSTMTKRSPRTGY